MYKTVRHRVYVLPYLFDSGVLADKDEEDEAAPEEIDAADDPEEPLSSREALSVSMVPMDKIVDTLKYPENAHHGE